MVLGSDTEMIFHEGLVEINLNVKSDEEVINILGNRLLNYGYVDLRFIESVQNREREFPTGLPSIIPVAIPHTNAGYCKKSAFAVGVLSKDVAFREMGSPQNTLPIEIVFLLAVAEPKEQVHWLKKFMNILKSEAVLREIRDSRTAGGIVDIINRVLYEKDSKKMEEKNLCS